MKGKEGCILKSFPYILFTQEGKKASGFSTVMNPGKRMRCKLPLTSLWGCSSVLTEPLCSQLPITCATLQPHNTITQPVKTLPTSPNAALPGPLLSLSLLITLTQAFLNLVIIRQMPSWESTVLTLVLPQKHVEQMMDNCFQMSGPYGMVLEIYLMSSSEDGNCITKCQSTHSSRRLITHPYFLFPHSMPPSGVSVAASTPDINLLSKPFLACFPRKSH